MMLIICSTFASSAGPRQPQHPNRLFGHQESHPARVIGPRQGSPSSKRQIFSFALHSMQTGYFGCYRLAEDHVHDDLFDLFLFYRASVDLEVHCDKVLERPCHFGLDRVASRRPVFSPTQGH